ncbi:MAG: glucose-6-phosphate 1-epimerase [Sulfurimonas sp.]|jgi:glucose-6-phosphate 1-epimerase|uniref:D-hexose-6-phosphate mutarotase n=1 Tax=Sulfurimonas sp. TaxID=2022749 RepID=UPI0039E2B271
MTELKEMDGGFTYLEIINDTACAEIALQGAHIFHFARNGENPILWLSDESDFEYGTAIRGGVPICWPSFGMNNPKLPQHGFARTCLWEFIEAKDVDSSTTEVRFLLKDSEVSREMWNNKFELELKVTVSDELIIELTTVNTDKKSFQITQALHSYFHISHIDAVFIEGLETKPYLDALTGIISHQEDNIFFDKEIDRVYQEVNKNILLKDINRTIELAHVGSLSSVIWNPWIEKAKRMSAMNDEAYKEFVCIETANAYADFKVLEPGESHTLKVSIFSYN